MLDYIEGSMMGAAKGEAEIAFRDGPAQKRKRAFLDKLREYLGIHGALAGKINAVMGIRDRST